MFLPFRDELEEVKKMVKKTSGAIIHAKWHYGCIPQSVGWIVGKNLKKAKDRERLKKHRSQTETQVEEAVKTPTPRHGKRGGANSLSGDINSEKGGQ